MVMTHPISNINARIFVINFQKNNESKDEKEREREREKAKEYT